MNGHAHQKNKNLDALIAFVNQSDISSIKNIVSRLMELINDPQSTVKELKDVIQVDPPLTGKLLKLANSPYYSPREKVSEIQQAVIWVGFDAIKELALNQKISEIYRKGVLFEGYSRNALWKHSLGVAMMCKMIYRREFGEMGENAYAAGLLHDIGLIAEEQFYEDRFKGVLSRSKKEQKNLEEAEYELFGHDHTEAGKAILEDWKIPERICAAIEMHHSPKEVPQEFLRITHTLHLADFYCQLNGIGFRGSPFRDKVDIIESVKLLGLEDHALDLLIEDVDSELMKMEEQGFFS